MPRIVGKWFSMNNRCINFTPEYRFAEIVKRIGKEYIDKNGYVCQKVALNMYGYKAVGYKTKPYVSDTTLYMPDGKPTSSTAIYRCSPKGIEVLIFKPFDIYYPWNRKGPIEVTTHYGYD